MRQRVLDYEKNENLFLHFIWVSNTVFPDYECCDKVWEARQHSCLKKPLPVKESMTSILRLPHFAEFPGLTHGFTTKELGADYDRLAVELKVLSSQIYYLEQIHSDRVIYLDDSMELSQLTPADALITHRKDVIIGVRTADCLPLLIYDDEQEVVAAVHAGYKGLLSGIIQNTVGIMTQRLGCEFENMYFALGPAISVAQYEVGPEVISEFEKCYGKRFSHKKISGKNPHLNLKETARMILEDIGMDDLHCMDMALCTFERADLFSSYRRGDRDQRQFNFIGMV